MSALQGLLKKDSESGSPTKDPKAKAGSIWGALGASFKKTMSDKKNEKQSIEDFFK